MSDDANERSCEVRSIAWTRIFPWLSLLGCFRQSLRLRLMLLALLGVLATTVGWRLIGYAFSGSDTLTESTVLHLYGDWPWERADSSELKFEVMAESREKVGDLEAVSRAVYMPPDMYPGADAYWTPSAVALMHNPLAHLLSFRPVRQILAFGEIFNPETKVVEATYLLCVLLWGLAVWAYVGGAITRIAAVAFARGEQISYNKSLDFARKKWASYFCGPAMPLVGVLLITLAMALFGLLIRIPYVGLLLGGLGWPAWMLGGFFIAVLVLGLVVAWPLMWATISAEGTDAFDALGRAYGYLFARPLRYLFYACFAAVLGCLGLIVVSALVNMILQTTAWATSWGSGDLAMDNLLSRDGAEELAYADRWGAGLATFWTGCLAMVPVAYVYSFFWTAATIVYFLLRRDEDQTDMDEVYLDDEDQSYGLPPLETDAAGVPGVADVPAEEPNEEASNDGEGKDGEA
jgi:hypothetical protein